MAEMTWGQVKTPSFGEGTPYVKLKPGDNIMRIVGLPYETEIHWEETIDGSKKRIVCSGMGCPICKAGHVPQKKFQVLVIDRTDKGLKILEGGNSIFKQIRDYAMDMDYGDPTKYDIKIKKEGSGRETRYTVVPSPRKSELTQEEAELLNNSKSLSEINKPKTMEELMQMNLSVLESLSGFGSGSSNSSMNDEWGTENQVSADNFSDDDWNSL